jgi:hypothetical protein
MVGVPRARSTRREMEKQLRRVDDGAVDGVFRAMTAGLDDHGGGESASMSGRQIGAAPAHAGLAI